MVARASIYDPGRVAFGGGTSASLLHPVVVAIVLVVAFLIFVLPRKYVIVPLLLGILLIPAGQNLYLGAHFYVARLLVLCGLTRALLMRSSAVRSPKGLNTIDKIFILWAVYRAMSAIIQFPEAGAALNQTAFLLEALGGYFLFRSLIRDDGDVQTVVKVFAVAAIAMSIVMIGEQMTGQNVFGLVGGIQSISLVRNGRIRAQGAFQISIIAGVFGAIVLPLFLWLWTSGKGRWLPFFGVVSSVVMVVTSASSTPVSALGGAVLGVCLWPVRQWMRLVRWGLVAGLIGMQLTMKAPVWFAIAHIDFVGGSGGWDRAQLIDVFLRHTGDWWLIGTHDNVNWGWDMWDECNQFVAEGENGGIVALGCFVATITMCFARIGRSIRAVRGERKQEWLFWLLGVTMFTQVVAFLGIDYFDQSKYFWYALLVMFTAATTTLQKTAAPGSEESMMHASFGLAPTAQPQTAFAGRLYGGTYLPDGQISFREDQL